jgi:hypothetical protein
MSEMDRIGNLMFYFGIAVMLLIAITFRREGISIRQVGSFRDLSQYLRPPGAALYILGLIVMVVGVLLSITSDFISGFNGAK